MKRTASAARGRARRSPAPSGATAIRRLNWGCGPAPPAGWINSDQIRHPGVDLACDIRGGLPVEDDAFDYIVSIHALEQVPYLDAVPVLRELRRVLRPGGVLRLGLPDLDRAIRAYLAKDASYFLIPDDEARTVGGKLSVQMTWYGTSRLLLTYEFTEELLVRAGFSEVRQCAFRQTASPYPDIVELDNREPESFFAEAVK